MRDRARDYLVTHISNSICKQLDTLLLSFATMSEHVRPENSGPAESGNSLHSPSESTLHNRDDSHSTQSSNGGWSSGNNHDENANDTNTQQSAQHDHVVQTGNHSDPQPESLSGDYSNHTESGGSRSQESSPVSGEANGPSSSGTDRPDSSNSSLNEHRHDFAFHQLIDAMFRGFPGASRAENGNSEGLDSVNAPDSDTTNQLTGASINFPGAPALESPSENAGAIVITVNYMFIEGGDNVNPGRTGSLVVTLPNNAANREPRIILQFISLATRMAYNALVTNAPKVHPGVTLEKFNSFAIKNASELADSRCLICFEEYEQIEPPKPEPKVEPKDEVVAAKKRKLGLDTHCVSALSSTERLDVDRSSVGTGSLSSDISGASTRPSPTSINTNTGTNVTNTGNNTGTNTDTNSDATASIDTNTETSTDTEEPQQKYLCEHNEEYKHVPLQMPCGHVFGQSCLSHWLKENTSCPLCRVSVGENRPRPQVAPISYIRFGGIGSDESVETSGLEPPVAVSPPPSRDPPPPPLLPPRQRRARNSGVSPVIDNILNYFGRARRQREQDGTTSPLFASGVASRRTPTGVHTVTSDSDATDPLTESLFANLASLTGDSGSSGPVGGSGGSNAPSNSGDSSNTRSSLSESSGSAIGTSEHFLEDSDSSAGAGDSRNGQ